MKNLLLLLFLSTTCISAQKNDSIVQQKVIGTFILSVGNTSDFGETSVKFIKIISDSRCPENVTCIWPGEVKLLLGIFKNGKLISEETIAIRGGGGKISLLGEHGIFLNNFSLSPYPDIKDPIQPEEYKLGFSLIKLTSESAE